MVVSPCLKPPSKNFSALKLTTTPESISTLSKTSSTPSAASISTPTLIIHSPVGPIEAVLSIQAIISLMAVAHSPLLVNASPTPPAIATAAKTKSKSSASSLIRFLNPPPSFQTTLAFSPRSMAPLKPTSKWMTLLPSSKTSSKT